MYEWERTLASAKDKLRRGPTFYKESAFGGRLIASLSRDAFRLFPHLLPD